MSDLTMISQQEKTHPYHWVMIAFSVIGAGLYVGSFFHSHFRILYDKYADFLPTYLIPVALGIIGTTFGMALAGLVAPESFLESAAGQRWLVGSCNSRWWQRLIIRLNCLVLVLLYGSLILVLVWLVYIDY